MDIRTVGSRWLQSVQSYMIEIILIAALAAAVGYFGYLGYGLVESPEEGLTFSGERALAHVEKQLEFGPRITGSEASRAMGDWLIEELSGQGWEVYIQPFEASEEDVSARNIIAVRGGGPSIAIGAHYDTRLFADETPDPANHTEPVPGANDGASGVAVLLELARSLDVTSSNHEVCLLFFDAEDNGRIPGWDWILGSRYYVSRLPDMPRCADPTATVIVDMIGDADQQVRRERSSTPALVDALWNVAAELGYADWIIDEPGYTILDDHTPFLEAGIPAADMIDFDYPYWHTVEDTLDKVSAESLERIGRTLEVWLEAGAPF